MKSEWFTPKEITEMPGMPTTIQGVHKKAKREGWRFRRKLGVQGPAVEYCMIAESPEGQVSENTPSYQTVPPTAEQELLAVWLAVFNQLTNENRNLLIANIIKYGVYRLINYENYARAESLAVMIEKLPAAEQALVLHWIKTKQFKQFVVKEASILDQDQG
ncbi:MAG: DNA-binding protein [Candidatus Symbiodolus clandestinus]